MHLKITALVAFAVLFAVLAGGCGAGGATPADEVSIRETAEQADPKAAITAIYDMVEDEEAGPVYTRKLAELLQVDPAELGELDDFEAYISDADYGLCDVIIIKTRSEQHRETLRSALRGYQDRRIAQFKGYDILDSYSISQNAVVFDLGEYIILLMTPDNEAAQELIDEYIPQ